ncbi:MAG TPA: hypothetical protein H9862_04705 [Candidatus Akkermansia intestinigallinarum]|uniref:Uncharacterized protein n=1 Tax=Candidatus Akkermansia intestinigallinarum TaxID=2838431 RepID=A0A9D1VBS1_9BACT|nr:hypothetical protein [Candidatus Akkermansia intestinigallinarum]
MTLRERLERILPDLLPARESEAIKGRELIARLRAVLGEEYSDHSLRSQFSFMALDPDSCLARVPNGQGYYRRGAESASSLHSLFESNAEAGREGADPFHKLLALAVRLYDTAGLGVFLYPVEDEESWTHPDLVAVQWPAGHLDPDGRYRIDESAEPAVTYRAVCLARAESDEDARRAFFRAAACGLWAQESELLLLPERDGAQDELQRLGCLCGVGVTLLDTDADELKHMPRAEALFRAGADAIRPLLSSLPLRRLSLPRRRNSPVNPPDAPELQAVLQWAQRCVARRCIEPYEQRVAAN